MNEMLKRNPSAAHDRTNAAGDHAELTTTEARQGITGVHLRYILGFGLAGVVIAFAVLFLVYFG